MSETTETPLWEQGESPTDTLDRWIAKGARRTGHINLSRDALKRLRARLTGEAQPMLRDPDEWAVMIDDEMIEGHVTEGEARDEVARRRRRLLSGWREAEGDAEYTGPTVGVEPVWIGNPLAAPPTAKAESPFKLPVRVVALVMPDAWAVYDAAGNLVAETYERERADYIAAAINAYAPKAKAPSGPLPTVAIGQNATGTNGAPSGASVSEIEAGLHRKSPDEGADGSALGLAGVPTPDEPDRMDLAVRRAELEGELAALNARMAREVREIISSPDEPEGGE